MVATFLCPTCHRPVTEGNGEMCRDPATASIKVTFRHCDRSQELEFSELDWALASNPDSHQQGSEERIAVMQARAACGLPIFNPNDRNS